MDENTSPWIVRRGEQTFASRAQGYCAECYAPRAYSATTTAVVSPTISQSRVRARAKRLILMWVASFPDEVPYLCEKKCLEPG
jgi:hypothetical protein